MKIKIIGTPRKDSKFPEENIPAVVSVYVKKIDMYKMLLMGKDPFY